MIDPLALSRAAYGLLEKGGVYYTVSHNMQGVVEPELLLAPRAYLRYRAYAASFAAKPTMPVETGGLYDCDHFSDMEQLSVALRG